jgi:hypothetical protein
VELKIQFPVRKVPLEYVNWASQMLRIPMFQLLVSYFMLQRPVVMSRVTRRSWPIRSECLRSGSKHLSLTGTCKFTSRLKLTSPHSSFTFGKPCSSYILPFCSSLSSIPALRSLLVRCTCDYACIRGTKKYRYAFVARIVRVNT